MHVLTVQMSHVRKVPRGDADHFKRIGGLYIAFADIRGIRLPKGTPRFLFFTWGVYRAYRAVDEVGSGPVIAFGLYRGCRRKCESMPYLITAT